MFSFLSGAFALGNSTELLGNEPLDPRGIVALAGLVNVASGVVTLFHNLPYRFAKVSTKLILSY
jgi:hypothetical protein